MPRKIRDLIRDLERAGFTNRGGKGSHRNFVHPNVRRSIVVAGTEGDDAKDYQEKAAKRDPGITAMKESARYAKIVEWSDVDDCYVGSSPGLFIGGCHGDDEQQVFAELCQIVEETIELYHQDGKPLPPSTSGRDFANKMQSVA